MWQPVVRTVKSIPITDGGPKTPTYNGQMVISEKFTRTRMDGSTVGFGKDSYELDVPHAMRLSTSGTFAHGRYRGDLSVFGRAGTSRVKNSPERTVNLDNGRNGWNMPWAEQQEGSAGRTS